MCRREDPFWNGRPINNAHRGKTRPINFVDSSREISQTVFETRRLRVYYVQWQGWAKSFKTPISNGFRTAQSTRELKKIKKANNTGRFLDLKTAINRYPTRLWPWVLFKRRFWFHYIKRATTIFRSAGSVFYKKKKIIIIFREVKRSFKNVEMVWSWGYSVCESECFLLCRPSDKQRLRMP